MNGTDNKQKPRLVTRTAMGSSIDKELYSNLQKYSKDTGIPISRCLDRAIDLFLKMDRKF